MTPFWILLEIRVIEVVVTTGAISRAKLQLKCHHEQTNTQFFYRPDALPVAQTCENVKTVKTVAIQSSWIVHSKKNPQITKRN